jgi:HK97 family phage portal protein
MGLWARMRRAWRSITLADFQQLQLWSPATTAGMSVSQYTALNYSAVWNAVHIIASQVASLPRVLYRRTEEDSRERAVNHPAYKVVNGEANATMTNFVFWQTLMSHVLTWGNAYAEIEFDRAQRPIALWPITPDQIQPQTNREVTADGRVSYRLWYLYKGTRRLEAEDVLHIPGLGYDGVQGYSVVSMARESIGLGLAAEQFGATFFGNGAYPGIVLEHPGKLSPEAQLRLKESWRRDSSGPRALGVQVAEEGMKVNKVGIPPEDAQFLQTREFQVVEIARWFNIPPHKLKHRIGERPGGNLEASQIEFLTDCLFPWLVTVEQECNRKLISSAQRSTYYVEHLTNALLRTDAKTRSEIQRAYFDMGVLDAETIAKQENLPPPKPKPKPVAEVQPELPEPKPEEDQPPEEDEPEAARMARAQRALLLDVVARFVRRESLQVRRASRQGERDFARWLEQFYPVEQERLRGLLEPALGVVLAWRGSREDVRGVSAAVAAAYVARSRGELTALPTLNLEGAASRLMERWETTRPVDLVEQLIGTKERVCSTEKSSAA